MTHWSLETSDFGSAQWVSSLLTFDSLKCLFCLDNRLREGSGHRMGWILEKIQTAFDPPPPLLENIWQIFMTDMVAYIQGDMMTGQYEMHAHAFFKVCLVLIFLNTIVEKHSLKPEITPLYRCHAHDKVTFWAVQDSKKSWRACLLKIKTHIIQNRNLQQLQSKQLWQRAQSVAPLFLSEKRTSEQNFEFGENLTTNHRNHCYGAGF